MEKDKDGIWQYKELGLDIIYKDGVKIPTKPAQPATVDPAKYFTSEDSVKYLEDIDKFEMEKLTRIHYILNVIISQILTRWLPIPRLLRNIKKYWLIIKKS